MMWFKKNVFNVLDFDLMLAFFITLTRLFRYSMDLKHEIIAIVSVDIDVY